MARYIEKSSRSRRKSKRRTKSSVITKKQIVEYIARKSEKKAMKVTKKLKMQAISGYSNCSNPFGDSNLGENFVWRKKIERDVVQGRSFDISVKEEKKRQQERMAELEKVKKRREERALEKARHEEEMVGLSEEQEAGSFSPQLLHVHEDEEAVDPETDRAELIRKREAVMEEHEGKAAVGDEMHDEYRPRKPKYFYRVHTGYEWNKYNQTHYDHDNPPPKDVHGYTFNIFYPDLVDKTKAPTYTIEKDGDGETCTIRFHAGPPYEDIAFRIVNKEWEYSRKKGFKCTFELGIMHLYVNLQRHGYRR